MKTTRCKSCGSLLRADSKMCTRCGKPLSKPLPLGWVYGAALLMGALLLLQKLAIL